MKYSLLTFLSVVIYAASFGQTIDYNKIVIPSDVKDIGFDERLIQLAWNNHPSNKLVLEELNHSNYFIKEARYNWLPEIYAVGNINEFNIDPSADLDNRSQFFPRYNFSVRFSLESFALTPIKVKAAKSQMSINSHLVNERKIEVRTNVLSTLERFKERYKILRFRRQLMEDVLQVYKDAEKQFYQGNIKMDEYRVASQAYSLRAESVIEAESEFNQIKLEIEGMIGLSMQDIIGYSEFLASIESSAN